MNAEEQRQRAIAMQRQAQMRMRMKQQEPSPAPVPATPAPEMGRVEAGIRGLNQGLTFGFGDELAAGLKAITSGQTYDEALEYQRGQDQQARDQRGGMMFGGEMAGGITSAVGAAPAALLRGGAGLASRIGLGARTGAVEGAVYGAGTSEGGMQNRAEGAGVGSMVGAGMGAAMVPAIGAATAGVKAIKEPVAGVLGIGNDRRARRVLVDRMQRAGKSREEIVAAIRQAADEGQPEYRMADALGYEGQRTLSSVARRPGEMRQEVVEQLDQRQAGQGERVSGFLSDALGGSDTAAERASAMTRQRGDVADRLYGDARQNAGPVDVRDALGAIDARIGGMQGSGVTGDGIDARLTRYRDRLAGTGEDGVDRELSDFDRVLGVKQNLQDDIGAAQRAGRNNEVRELTKLERQLDRALEGSSDGYRAANDRFRTDSRAIEQVDAGKKAAQPNSRAEDTLRQFGGLSSNSDTAPALPGQVPMDQRSAFRTGYGEPMFAKLGSAAEGVNNARQFTTPKRQQEIGAMATDPGLFQRRVQRENQMFETRRQATGGSLTANNQEDNAEMAGQEIGGIFRQIANAANFRFGDIVTEAAQAAQGQNDGTRQLIAKALMAEDPTPFLAQIPQEERQRFIAALVARASARQPATRETIDGIRP